jgi:hypothetical protein
VVVKGPRQYVVPIDAPQTVPEPVADSDVSQVDVAAGGEPSATKAPRAYQVVSMERFQAYERTGILPPVEPDAAAPAAPATDAATTPAPGPAAQPAQNAELMHDADAVASGPKTGPAQNADAVPAGVKAPAPTGDAVPAGVKAPAPTGDAVPAEAVDEKAGSSARPSDEN